MARSNSNSRPYPLTGRCTTVLLVVIRHIAESLLIASFPGVILVALSGVSIPWEMCFVAGGVSIKGLSVLTGHHSEESPPLVRLAAEIVKRWKRVDG